MRNTYGYESYRGRSGARTVLTVLAVILLVVLLLAVAFFFFAQQYIVYDDNGRAHLELPFFQLEPQPSAAPEPTQTPHLVVVTAEPSAQPTAPPEAALTAVELPLSALTDGSAQTRISAAGGGAALFSMKDAQGRLGYVSALELAIQAEVSAADPGLNDAIRTLNGGDLYTVARVSCFKDNAAPKRFPYRAGVTLRTDIGNWRDPEGIRWFSPAAAEARDYLTGICLELAELGFDEILLEECTFPTTEGLERIVRGEPYDESTLSQDLGDFYAQVHDALADQYPQVKLSLTAAPGLLSGDPNDKSGQTPDQLKAYADRVWLPVPGEGQSWADAAERLDLDAARLVYPGEVSPIAGAGRLIVPQKET